MPPGLVDILLATVFDRVPPMLREMGVHHADPRQFGCGPIWSSTGRHRFYLADTHDPLRWERGLPDCGDFLRPCGRRMLDTDGERHEVYLDDLHQEGGDLMCQILSLPGGERSAIHLIDEIPPAFARFGALASLGRLALRTGPVEHLIWVTEARHTGLVEETTALARSVVELPHALDLPGAYIDALDLTADTVDLTPGFL